MDDPLSAVDAHVGHAILEKCLLAGPLARKTRVLVTHALNVLSRVDLVYVVEGGVVVEKGTYQVCFGVFGLMLCFVDGGLGLGAVDGRTGVREAYGRVWTTATARGCGGPGRGSW